MSDGSDIQTRTRGDQFISRTQQVSLRVFPNEFVAIVERASRMYPVSIVALIFVATAVVALSDRASALTPDPGDVQYDILFGREPRNGNVGDACRNNDHCKKNLCCLASSCQPRSPPGHPCSDEQIKGGTYVKHCPCLSGDGAY